MPRIRRLSVAALAFVAVFGGCASWKPFYVPVGASPTVTKEQKLRVTRTDGTKVVVEQPAIVGDSLTGNAGDPPSRVAIALRDVRFIEESKVSALRTGGVAVGAGLVVVGVLLLGAILWFVTHIE